ncbi:MAG: acyl-homoserine-lactone synthase [Gammaproteobacteria bacterium]
MRQILLGKASDRNMDWTALRGMFRLRHTVFYQRLRWDVKSIGDLERNDYDELAPVYLVSRDHQRRVDGCLRLFPTTGSYMLKDTFPELLRGEAAPSDPHVWELSRFTVTPSSGEDCRQASLSNAALDMMRRLYEFGRENDIHSYVAVISVSLERLLRSIGLPLRRFGDGKTQRIGTVLSVACWIPVNEESRRALYATLDAERRAA